MVLSIGMFSACNEDVSVDSIYITAAENTPITNFSAKKTGDALGITISSALIAKSDIEGELLVENALVASYNSAHGEDYQSLPNGVCELSDTHVKIVNGNYRSEAVKLVVKDIEALKKGVNYLVPIRLVSNAKRYPVLPGSDVLYVVINRTLLMNVPKFNGENYFKVNFKDKSAWLFVDGTPDRVGGAGNVPVFMFGVKQWSVYAGKLGFTLAKNEWYHVAGVFSNNKLLLYIDGILFAEAEYKKKVSFTKNFYIGAAPGVQDGFFLKGSVSEARLWTRALTAAELRNPLHRCFVEVDSKGLEGYWKLDDMSDNCKDYTGHGHTAVKGGEGKIEWIKEVPCP